MLTFRSPIIILYLTMRNENILSSENTVEKLQLSPSEIRREKFGLDFNLYHEMGHFVANVAYGNRVEAVRIYNSRMAGYVKFRNTHDPARNEMRRIAGSLGRLVSSLGGVASTAYFMRVIENNTSKYGDFTSFCVHTEMLMKYDGNVLISDLASLEELSTNMMKYSQLTPGDRAVIKELSGYFISNMPSHMEKDVKCICEMSIEIVLTFLFALFCSIRKTFLEKLIYLQNGRCYFGPKGVRDLESFVSRPITLAITRAA